MVDGGNKAGFILFCMFKKASFFKICLQLCDVHNCVTPSAVLFSFFQQSDKVMKVQK